MYIPSDNELAREFNQRLILDLVRRSVTQLKEIWTRADKSKKLHSFVQWYFLSKSCTHVSYDFFRNTLYVTHLCANFWWDLIERRNEMFHFNPHEFIFVYVHVYEWLLVMHLRLPQKIKQFLVVYSLQFFMISNWNSFAFKLNEKSAFQKEVHKELKSNQWDLESIH